MMRRGRGQVRRAQVRGLLWSAANCLRSIAENFRSNQAWVLVGQARATLREAPLGHSKSRGQKQQGDLYLDMVD
jgi:hypothetical protein